MFVLLHLTHLYKLLDCLFEAILDCLHQEFITQLQPSYYELLLVQISIIAGDAPVIPFDLQVDNGSTDSEC